MKKFKSMPYMFVKLERIFHNKDFIPFQIFSRFLLKIQIFLRTIQ